MTLGVDLLESGVLDTASFVLTLWMWYGDVDG
jgi:hypothetical protein